MSSTEPRKRYISQIDESVNDILLFESHSVDIVDDDSNQEHSFQCAQELNVTPKIKSTSAIVFQSPTQIRPTKELKRTNKEKKINVREQDLSFLSLPIIPSKKKAPTEPSKTSKPTLKPRPPLSPRSLQLQIENSTSPKRLYVMKELLQTENNYLSSLGEVVVLRKQLEEKKYLSPKLLEQVFPGEWDKMYDLHKEIIRGISIEDYFVFKKLSDHSSIYEDYSRKYEETIMMGRKIYMSDRKFRDFIQKVHSFGTGPEVIDTLAIRPIQRILKYPLLLSELQKTVGNDYQKKSDLEDAIKITRQFGVLINEKKRESVSSSKLKELEQYFKQAQDEEVDTQSLIVETFHTFEPHTFAGRECGLCGKLITLSSGYQCTVCQFPIHNNCKDQALKLQNCKRGHIQEKGRVYIDDFSCKHSTIKVQREEDSDNSSSNSVNSNNNNSQGKGSKGKNISQSATNDSLEKLKSSTMRTHRKRFSLGDTIEKFRDDTTVGKVLGIVSLNQPSSLKSTAIHGGVFRPLRECRLYVFSDGVLIGLMAKSESAENIRYLALVKYFNPVTQNVLEIQEEWKEGAVQDSLFISALISKKNEEIHLIAFPSPEIRDAVIKMIKQARDDYLHTLNLDKN